ncbi:Uncharacterised protein [Vibrio cholerae]|uniref:Uncharacterized protein n=1 Tax=Vibrio cholerae TaxID=666 RepID=A0A656AS22_VIBCL|nr:Uncharacterised protein [Vibrio cholerae]CSC23966.1 Uncharacterised protein [Vibrio cholerae]CSD30915.1 Uncharacterised protein [Vibrio cholerae]CSI78549.1 Uncharacterised protein [Vibrio cholerae]
MIHAYCHVNWVGGKLHGFDHGHSRAGNHLQSALSVMTFGENKTIDLIREQRSNFALFFLLIVTKVGE